MYTHDVVRKAARLTLAAVLLTLALAACSGDGDGGGASTAATAPSASAPAPAATAPPISALEDAALRGVEVTPPTYRDENQAPEFTGLTRWLNSDPLTIPALAGQVTLIDFWTYT